MYIHGPFLISPFVLFAFLVHEKYVTFNERVKHVRVLVFSANNFGITLLFCADEILLSLLCEGVSPGGGGTLGISGWGCAARTLEP